MPPDTAVTPSHFTEFGELLHYLRRRAGLTQRELSLAMGYSDSHISRLEHNQRVPERTTLLALFVPALDIVHESGWTTRLLELAAEARLAEFSLSGVSTNPTSTHNLPLQLTSFLGRELEVAQVVGLLSPASSQAPAGLEKRPRLVTLTGPGGVGKTRLAIQAAANLVEVFPDGVCMIDFAPLADPALVPQTVAASLGLREEGSQSMLANLISHLRLKTSLLLLDNCEHLIDACANLAADMLQACPNVSILATSREALKIAGETAVIVDPLPVPKPDHSLTIEELIKYDGVRLFVERAQAALPSFTLTAVNSLAVAEVCRRLDGLPLAIELAAARVGVLSVAHIAARLADSFHLLGHGSRTALPRAQTLHTCMDWSYDLLSEPERLLQNRLAVFAGGWTLEAAESVCTDDRIHPHEALNLLSQLVAKSLVVVDRRPDRIRYRFLETIYQYALEKLNSSGEFKTLKDKHLDYFLSMIETTGLESNEHAIYEGLNQIEADYDNLRAALEWSLARGVDYTLSFRLLKQLGIFWKVRGFLDEGRLILSAFLARPGASDMTVERAWLLCQHAVLAGLQSDVRAALPLLEESRAIYKQLQPAGMDGEVDVLTNLAVLEIDSGEAKIALEHAQNALAIAVEIDYPRGVRSAHHVLGVALGHLGQYEQAAEHLEASLELDRKMGGLMNITLILNLGELAVRQGDYAKAKALLQDGLIKAIEAKDKWEIGANLGTQAWIALLLGEFEQARQLLGESLAVRQEIGDNGGIAWCLEKLAESADIQGSAGIAVRLMGKAASLRLMSNSQVNSADRPDYDRFMGSLRERIEPGAFASAWESGASMPLDSAIHLVL
jgi:predicted ATPase/transcriptional regulator with XRE-family HTH domain